ncbi:MAG: AAA family ATPase [Deltaproteobacteria bacterium]|nr:AAA family ATPase [Deltaproteobacteria bacterium]
MPHIVNHKDLELIHDEETRYQGAHRRIVEAARVKSHQLRDDQALARTLTGEMVATQREEEKQALQSDESVAHGLAALRLKQSRELADLMEQPYFARVIYHEKERDVEFKLGLASFPELRIVDWRKAPVSKLYYNYEEGDHYDDEIAGFERHGKILLKRAYRGSQDTLSAIELKDVCFVQSRGQWHRQSRERGATFSIKDKAKIKELLSTHNDQHIAALQEQNGYLKNILSLLSVEQFRLISSADAKPVVIQGSAGTGKTTVALHRLAWLMFEDNSKAREANTLVIMFNTSLAAYVRHVLPELGIRHIAITTFYTWARDIIETTLGCVTEITDHSIPDCVARFKSDPATLMVLKKYLDSSQVGLLPGVLFNFYRSDAVKAVLTTTDTDGLIAGYLDKQGCSGALDCYDTALMLHIIFFRNHCYRSKKYPAALECLIVDEAQDFTITELKAVLNALEDKNKMALAGDLGQRVFENRGFGSWNELLEELGLESGDIINLNVAYRCTYQIYELAEHIRNPDLKNDDLHLTPLFGPEPVLTLCHGFSDAVLEAKKWMDDIIKTNRHTTGAVICKTSAEARLVYDALVKAGTYGIRYGDAQHFEFTPGITITDVKQVKGLEFVNVLVFNPSENHYNTLNDYDRNLLYVAVTRAQARLDLVCYDAPSTLIPDFICVKNLTEIRDDPDTLPLFSDIDQDTSVFDDTHDAEESSDKS